MGSIESDRLFFFLTAILLLIVQYCGLTTAQPMYLYHFCFGGNYSTSTAAGSTYRTNLKVVLNSLSSKFQSRLGLGKGYYYNKTVGQNADTVYGSFQCRGDTTSEACQECVNTTAQAIRDRCPISKKAIIWYDVCMLRYSNQSFFSIMQERPAVYMCDAKNISNPSQFNQTLNGLMDDLVTKAVSDGSSPYNFATGEANFTTFWKIYGLVQCTFDLSNTSCNRCLRGAIANLSNLCDGKEGGGVIGPSCYFRYETYPFYKLKATPPAATPLPSTKLTNTTKTKTKGKNSKKFVIIVVPSLITVVSTMTIWYFCLQRRKATKKIDEDVEEIQSAESLQFNFSTIIAATNNFSDANKLGRGGFGSVYKGTLSDGQEIAVKRLSKSSGQGEEEFKTEVVLLVKLQHKNLVRLLGFCLEGEEKLLIYEFMPNGSLDHFLFNPIKRTYLDWERRYKIIGGIARGILYLHEDSRLKIIHRDLKASNILLGADMIPKISDFGMARIFMVNQTQANTNRICGTYGYMAPEYAMHGHFSMKSDVFSFGVLVLEILIGQRSNSFYGSEGAQNLLSYAWKHWREGTTLELLDPTVRDRYSRIEVMRCIHIGLLCVQEDVATRPTMTWIVRNLNKHSPVNLPSPSSPSAFFVRTRNKPTVRYGENENLTVNEASITELYPR